MLRIKEIEELPDILGLTAQRGFSIYRNDAHEKTHLDISCRQEGITSRATLDVYALVLPKEVAKLLLSDAHTHGGLIEVRSDVFGQLGHVGLAEPLNLGLGFVVGIDVGTSDGGPDVESRQGIGKDGVEAKGLDDVGIHVMAEMDRPLVGSNGRRVLDAISAVHPRRADVVDPSHTKLNEALGFHELLGHESVAGVALKDLSRE